MTSARAYIATTGIAFVLIVVAHVVRVIEEGAALARAPSFLLFTAIAAVLAAWAGWALRKLLRDQGVRS